MLLDSPICDFGWQAPDFQLKDPDGREYTLDSVLGEKGLLIAFICNHCPYVQAIIDRLVEDSVLLVKEGINTVAIMPNDYEQYPADNPENMKKFIQQYDIHFPYLIDEMQAVARSYNAVCTPDFFGLNSKKELQYRGRLDDAKMNDASNRTAELLNAMQQVAQNGIGPKEQTPSMGCSIKWKS